MLHVLCWRWQGFLSHCRLQVNSPTWRAKSSSRLTSSSISALTGHELLLLSYLSSFEMNQEKEKLWLLQITVLINHCFSTPCVAINHPWCYCLNLFLFPARTQASNHNGTKIMLAKDEDISLYGFSTYSFSNAFRWSCKLRTAVWTLFSSLDFCWGLGKRCGADWCWVSKYR